LVFIYLLVIDLLELTPKSY